MIVIKHLAVQYSGQNFFIPKKNSNITKHFKNQIISKAFFKLYSPTSNSTKVSFINDNATSTILKATLSERRATQRPGGPRDGIGRRRGRPPPTTVTSDSFKAVFFLYSLNSVYSNQNHLY